MCLFIIFRYLLRTDELPQSQGRKSYREKAKNNVQTLNEQNESAPKEKGKNTQTIFFPPLILFPLCSLVQGRW